MATREAAFTDDMGTSVYRTNVQSSPIQTAPVSVQTDRTLHLMQQHDELNGRYTALLNQYGAHIEGLERWLSSS